MRGRFDAAVSWLNERAVAAGGSGPELAAATTVAAFAALGSRRLEILGPIGWSVLVAVLLGVVEQALRARFFRASRLVRGLRAAAPPVVLFSVSVWMLWPIWRGHETAFLDQDNTTHVERARVFWEALSHGRWPYWTNVLQGGEPLADAYGWLGNLLPPLFRALSLGRLTFERAYVCTLAALHGLSSVAVYALARRFTRRTPAFVTGLLFIVGGHLVPYMTGDRPLWHLHLHMGLWHSFFAALLAMFAAARLIDVIRRGRLGDAIALSVLVTAACLAHGFGTLAIVTLLGCTAAAGLLSPRASSRRTWLGVYALACGLLMAAAWTYPASRVLSEYGLRFPRPPHEDDQSLVEFVGPLSTATLLAGGVASFAALFQRDRLLAGISLAGLSTILLDEAGIVSQLGLADSPAGRAMQWHRLTLIFVLASTAPLAVMIGRMLDRAPRGGAGGPLSLRTVGARAIGIAVTFLFVAAPLVTTMGHGRHLLKKPEVTKVDDEPGFRALEEALRRLRQSDRGAYRVYFGAHPGSFASMALALRTGVPITALFHPPGQFLMNRPQTADPQELRAWGNKYLLYDAGMHVSPYWKEVETIGAYKLYRDEAFPGFVRTPIGVNAEVTRFDDTELRFRVTGAPPEGVDVQVAIAFYPRFRAYQDGQPIEVGIGRARPEGPSDQIALRVRNGEIVLRPDGRLPSSANGWGATAVGLGLFWVLVALRVSARLRARLRALLERAEGGLARAHALLSPGRSAVVVLVSLALFAIGANQPRRVSASPQLRPFFGDRHAVVRNEQECLQSLTTRKWICGEQFEQADAEVFHSVANEPTPNFWLQGDSWSSLRVVEHEGQSLLRVRFRKMRVSRFLHVRMAPHGAMPWSMHVRVNDGPLRQVAVRHGWATVNTEFTGVGDVFVEMKFSVRGGIDLAVMSDGSGDTPQLPKQ